MTGNAEKPQELPRNFYRLNVAILSILVGLSLTLIGLGWLQGGFPYDYGILQRGSNLFCFHPEDFVYSGEHLYPAPFYTTFCGLFRYMPVLLFVLWTGLPFLIVLWLGGKRAAVLVYPPFVIHTILGQSTWLLLPIYWLALQADRNKKLKWWYGLAVPFALFKPHISLLPLAWLVYHERRNIAFWGVSIVSSLLAFIPAFILQPNWVTEWLSAGRGYKIPSIANIGIFPIQVLRLGDTQTALLDATSGQLVVLAFCGSMALALLFAIYQRRGTLTLYDWVLVFALTNPFMHDYDLIILLPFIANRPKRLLIAVVAGLVVWVSMAFTTYYNASIVITFTLFVVRLLRVDEHEPVKPALHL